MSDNSENKDSYDLYETDEMSWYEIQIDHLEKNRMNELDRDNLIALLESKQREEKRYVRDQLVNLITKIMIYELRSDPEMDYLSQEIGLLTETFKIEYESSRSFIKTCKSQFKDALKIAVLNAEIQTGSSKQEILNLGFKFEDVLGFLK